MQLLYPISEPTAYELSYVKNLTFDQILAHLEFLGSLLFFGAKKASGNSDRCDWESLADTIDYAMLERVDSVPLAMSFLGKVGLFGRQKYRTIRDNLQLIGLFVVKSIPGRQGPQNQEIGELLDLNLRKIVELVRDLCDRIHEIIIDPEKHSLWPNHGFAFLMRWHTRVFGYHPGDRAHSAEIKATALNDREEMWQRTLHHEEVDAYVKAVENEELSRRGWVPEVVENVRSRLAYPESGYGAKLWAKLCPSLSRLTVEEIQFMHQADFYLFRDHLPSWGAEASEAAQFQVALENAIEYAKDKNNGTGKGRPIAAVNRWAWDEIMVKKREYKSKPLSQEALDRAGVPAAIEMFAKFFGVNGGKTCND